VPQHCRMRAFDRDLIRGGHYGQRSREAASTGRTHGCSDQTCDVQKVLANTEPSTHGTARLISDGRFWTTSTVECRRASWGCRLFCPSTPLIHRCRAANDVSSVSADRGTSDDDETSPEADMNRSWPATTVSSPTTSAIRRIASGSYVDLLCNLYRVIDLDSEIPDGALDLRMPEQELDCSQIASTSVDQHGLCATQRVRAEFGRVKPDTGNHS
jgi:hypothetical protein